MRIITSGSQERRCVPPGSEENQGGDAWKVRFGFDDDDEGEDDGDDNYDDDYKDDEDDDYG